MNGWMEVTHNWLAVMGGVCIRVCVCVHMAKAWMGDELTLLSERPSDCCFLSFCSLLVEHSPAITLLFLHTFILCSLLFSRQYDLYFHCCVCYVLLLYKYACKLILLLFNSGSEMQSSPLCVKNKTKEKKTHRYLIDD